MRRFLTPARALLLVILVVAQQSQAAPTFAGIPVLSPTSAEQLGQQGTTVNYEFTLTNIGDADAFTLSLVNIQTTNNAPPFEGALNVASPVTMDPNMSLQLMVVIQIPPTVLAGTRDVKRLRVINQDGTGTEATITTTTTPSPTPILSYLPFVLQVPNTPTTTSSPTSTSSPVPSATASAHATATVFQVPTLIPTSTTTRTTAPTNTPQPPTPTRDPARCAEEYPTVCIPPPPPDLNCADISFRRFTVRPPDRHNFDTDNDGIGCET